MSSVGLESENGVKAQGWGVAASLVGIALILFSGIGHVVAWLYVSLAPANMTDLDTRLGFGVCVTYAVLMLSVGITAIVAGGLGVREARKRGMGRAFGFFGLFLSIVGTWCWLMSATNLIIVAVARLR